MADRPVVLIYGGGGEDRSPASFRSYRRSYGYYDHVGSCRRVAMETLNRSKQCSKSHLLFEDHNYAKKELLVTR